MSATATVPVQQLPRAPVKAGPWAPVTHWAPIGEGRFLAETAVRVGGMHCSACASAIEAALRKVAGVEEARVSGAAHCAVVRWDPDRTGPARWVEAIENAGYTAVPDTAADARVQRRHQERAALWQLFVAAFCAMQVMMLAMPAYVSEAGDLSPDLKRLLDWGSWVTTLPVMCFSGMPFFEGAWRSLREGRIGMDVPVSLGIAIAFLASSAALFDPDSVFGREVYFDSVTMFISFLLGGRYLEMRARHRAETRLEESIEAWTQTASRVMPNGGVEDVAIDEVQCGEVLRVPVGQVFAVDGLLLCGPTSVDESMLSGESAPVIKGAGSAVVAGSLNLGAPVDVRVMATRSGTRYEQIMALVREAQTRRTTAAQQAADRWAGPFLWTILVLAMSASLVWLVIDPARSVSVAVAVLIVTCPCALSLAAPSGMLAATSALARRGLLLRRLEAIEGLARMTCLFIDKTGTLTQPPGRDAPMQRLASSGAPPDVHLRAVAATLATWSSHPLARALGLNGREGLQADMTQVRELRGHGMLGVDGSGGVWKLGSADWAGGADRPFDNGTARLWLSRDDQAMACFQMDEPLRADAATCVKALQADGVRVILISGDTVSRVASIAGQVGVDEFHGGLQPEEKLRMLADAQRGSAVVAMVGDGINDAPALAQADLSIAMGEGAWAARAQADGVLVSNGLGDLVEARALAKKTLRVVNQNLAWAAIYNLACVPMALMGWLPPWAAGLGMAASSLGVVLNAMRLSR